MTTFTGMSSLPFPHLHLTPIDGKPTATTVTQLRKEVYANARAIHSDGGGGNNGFLGIVMEAPAYLQRAGTAFLLPIHPGPQLDHAVNATAAQITAANRAYDSELDVFRRYVQVNEAIRQQILIAVDSTYYNVLEDDTFGYADVTIIVLLAHLQLNYATLSADDLEFNRMRLSETWNPDEPLENLWIKVKHLRAVALAGGEPFLDSTVMRLLLSALEKAGVYTHSICTWRDKPELERNWGAFQTHFIHGEKERLRLLTAGTTGYHGAHSALANVLPSFAAAASVPVTPAPSTTQFRSNNINLFYCWSHGLNRNPAHTSATCTHPADGHQVTATLDKRMGGSGRITFGDRTGSGSVRLVTPRSSATQQ